MFTETTIAGIRARLAEKRAVGARVALVPTMGALHAGHLRLIDVASESADIVVASIFVNPLQFGPNEDLARYPRTLENDEANLVEHGAALLFAPSVEEMYADGGGTTIAPAPFAARCEGAVRPGHFAGVLTVVAKLFNIVQPDVSVFGRKDLQQLALIRRMVADLNFATGIVGMDTVREVDGLALSSRNRYLDEQARAVAPRIRAALVAARAAFQSGVTDAASIEAAGVAVMAKEPQLAIDYFAVVRESDFDQPAAATPGDSIVTAVRLGTTRLIDNIQL
ncbi:MAG: pantoate--beta-alanine ligase [Gemmatimonadaceae bacterium]